MQRRQFISLVGCAAAWPLAARAQQGAVKRIGHVGTSTADSLPERLEAFRAGLRDLGYQEGRDLVIEYRWANGDYARLPALFDDLVRLKADVIVTHGTPGVMAAKQITSTTPIVIAVVGDALASGLVSNLARPGGNVTGLTFFQPELIAKRLELLKEAMPNLTDVGLLLNSANRMNEAVLPQVAPVASALKLTLHQFDVRTTAQLEGSFAAMAQKHIRALVAFDDAVLLSNAKPVAAFALKQRIAVAGWIDVAFDGGLLAYGVNFPDMYRRAAAYVDKIFKGTNPGDLPVERATKFETILNLKTAKALGLEIPASLLLRADQVVE
jgi:putative ABC transport system substrate-binding protein